MLSSRCWPCRRPELDISAISGSDHGGSRTLGCTPMAGKTPTDVKI